jgi:type III restriction enzyme
VPGNLPLFSNVVESVDAAQNRWQGRPNTLLIDSAQLESGGAMDPAFRKIAAVEIAEFKEELRRRDPSRADEDVPDEELLREVMNTVGKAGRLGEHIRCVVSVSMLTEGWDANTVSHILGIRAFGTQLLCEQVIGRGLRRVSYEADEHGMFAPEYAEVYGVPFSFIPTEPPGPQKPRVLPAVHRVVAQPDKAQYELTFPHLLGYRFDLPTERISATFDEASRMMLATDQVPTWIEVDPIVGEKAIMDLDDLRKRRMQEVAFRIAKRTLDRFFRTEGGDDRPWLFPQLVGITQRWLDTCVTCKDDTFPQLLLLSEWESVAAEKIYRSVDGKAKGADGEPRLLPLLRPYDHVGTTARVDFTTTKPVWPAEKSHLNWVAEDSSWESKVAQTLDHMPEVHAYVKNQGLGLRIPYTFEGLAAHYVPDLLVRLDDGRADPLNLLIEVTGQRRKDKAAKVDAAQKQWVPAVNNHGGFGRWSFIEVTDKDNAATLIRAHILASRSE